MLATAIARYPIWELAGFDDVGEQRADQLGSGRSVTPLAGQCKTGCGKGPERRAPSRPGEGHTAGIVAVPRVLVAWKADVGEADGVGVLWATLG